MLIVGPEICHIDRCPHGCTPEKGCQGIEYRLNHAEDQLRTRLADLVADGAKCGFEVVGAVSEHRVPSGAPYGIIDPDYARVFTIARCLAWSEGYALMMHGSFTRDLDLLAVPWAEKCCEPEHLINRIEQAADLKVIGAPSKNKPHGRVVWTMVFKKFADPRFIDIGVMPRKEPTP